jgi:DNA (cytosine-5)-methyltransferase 1
VDRLTLSFGKWRTEALKAYGNAIVPQVMYEIFRAIDIIENHERKLSEQREQCHNRL